MLQTIQQQFKDVLSGTRGYVDLRQLRKESGFCQDRLRALALEAGCEIYTRDGLKAIKPGTTQWGVFPES